MEEIWVSDLRNIFKKYLKSYRAEKSPLAEHVIRYNINSTKLLKKKVNNSQELNIREAIEMTKKSVLLNLDLNPLQ